MRNPYEILGVTNRSSQLEIKEAYRRLSLVHHPDRGGITTRFIEIKKAYDVLKAKKSCHAMNIHHLLSQNHTNLTGRDGSEPKPKKYLNKDYERSEYARLL